MKLRFKFGEHTRIFSGAKRFKFGPENITINYRDISFKYKEFKKYFKLKKL